MFTFLPCNTACTRTNCFHLRKKRTFKGGFHGSAHVPFPLHAMVVSPPDTGVPASGEETTCTVYFLYIVYEPFGSWVADSGGKFAGGNFKVDDFSSDCIIIISQAETCKIINRGINPSGQH